MSFFVGGLIIACFLNQRSYPTGKSNLITLDTTAGAGLRHSTDAGVVFDVGGFEDVAALGAAELGDTSHHKRFVLLLQK